MTYWDRHRSDDPPPSSGRDQSAVVDARAAASPVPPATGAASGEPASFPKPPYPFCHHPDLCAGRGSCPRDIACNH